MHRRIGATVISILVLPLIAVAGIHLKDWLLDSMLQIRDQGVARVQQQFGTQLRWRTISPSIINGITFFDVQAERVFDRPGTNWLRAESLELVFDYDAIWEEDYVRAVSEVVLNGLTVNVKTRGDQRILARIQEFLETAPERVPDVSLLLRNASIDVARGPIHFTMGGLNGRLTTLSGQFDLSLRSDVVVKNDEAELLFRSGVQTALNGAVTLRDYEGIARLNRPETAVLATSDLSVAIQKTSEHLELRKIEDLLPFDLSVRFATQTQNVSGSITAEEWRPADTIDLFGQLEQYRRFLDLTLDTRSTFTFNPTTQDLSARGTLSTYLNIRELPEPVSIATDYAYTGTRLDLDQALITEPRGGTARFTGSIDLDSRLPTGYARLSSWTYAGLPEVSGNVRVTSRDQMVSLYSSQFTVQGISVENVSSTVDLSHRYLSADVSLQLADAPGGLVSVSTSQVPGTNGWSGRVRLFQMPTSPIVDTISELGYDLPTAAEPYARNYELDLDARFWIGHTTPTVEIAYLNYVNLDDPADYLVTTDTRIVGSFVDVRSLAMQYDGIPVVGALSADFGAGGAIDFTTDITIASVEFPSRGTLTPGGDIYVAGPHSLDLRVTKNRTGGYQVRVSVKDLPVPTTDIVATVDARGTYWSPDEWYLAVENANVQGIPVPTGQVATARFSASVRPNEIFVQFTSFDDGISRLTGSLDGVYEWGNDPYFAFTANARGIESQEMYRIAARWNRDTFRIDVDFEAMPVIRLTTAGNRTGLVSGSVQMALRGQAILARVDFGTQDLVVDDENVDIAGTIVLSETDVEATNLRILWGPHRIAVGRAYFSQETGDVQLTGEYRRPERELTLPVTITGSTTGFGRWPPGSLEAIRDLEGQATVDIGGPRPQTWQAVRDGPQTSVRRSDGAFVGTVSDDLEFALTVQDPFPVAGNITGSFSDGQIEATASGITGSLTRIAQTVELPPALDIQQGNVSGNLRILGPPSDPDLFGTVRLTNIVMNNQVIGRTIGPGTVVAILEEKTVRIPRVQLPVGGQPVAIEGSMVLQRARPVDYRITIETVTDEGLSADSQFGAVSMDGNVRGRLVISGTESQASLEGNLELARTQIALGQRQSSSRASEQALDVNLTLQAGRSVQFIWPNSDIPILRSNFAVGDQVSFSLDGDTGEFSLTGDVEIQSGDIFYFDRSFLIRSGSIEFDETAEQFDPEITVRAEIREATPEGPVRIFLVADQDRLSEFSPQFESNPPLPGTDIVAILGGNILRQSPDGTVTLPTALLSTSDIVTQFGVFRQFEEQVRQSLDLDLFAVRTSVLQNLVLTAISPELGGIPASPTLGRYLDNTSVFAGRYLADELFGQLVLQMRSAEALGVPETATGAQQVGGVLIESEISLEWQTPFFLLEWTLAPQNPEELFIRDNTFTFSWRYSY